MPCPEISYFTENPYNDYDEIQRLVSDGFYSWRLDPIQTSIVVGVYRLGLKTDDTFTFVQTYQELGIQRAIVQAEHSEPNLCRYVFDLLQPVRQGTGGIWVVDSAALR